jgi:hypothetical protein
MDRPASKRAGCPRLAGTISGREPTIQPARRRSEQLCAGPLAKAEQAKRGDKPEPRPPKKRQRRRSLSRGNVWRPVLPIWPVRQRATAALRSISCAAHSASRIRAPAAMMNRCKGAAAPVRRRLPCSWKSARWCTLPSLTLQANWPSSPSASSPPLHSPVCNASKALRFRGDVGEPRLPAARQP